MSTTATTTNESAKQGTREGRDARGRFAAGNAGGPGNPFARKVAALRKTLVNFVTEDDMKHIAFVLKMKAEGGDLQAMKLLFQYVIGKPCETVDPDRLDVAEWQNLQEHARPAEEMSQVMGRLPADLACDMTKIAWPCEVERGFGAPMLAGLRAMDERDTGQEAAAKETAGVKAAERKVRDRPMTNGENGHGPEARERLVDGPSPSADGSSGEGWMWLVRLLHEAQRVSGRSYPDVGDSPSANGGNGQPGRANT